MRLSNAYATSIHWAMVYHTQPDSEEVEFIVNKFFNSKREALDWFNRKRKAKHFIQPEAVKITNLFSLHLA